MRGSLAPPGAVTVHVHSRAAVPVLGTECMYRASTVENGCRRGAGQQTQPPKKSGIHSSARLSLSVHKRFQLISEFHKRREFKHGCRNLSRKEQVNV